jgi:tetratricopeptide (TPR) repeat protein
MILSNIRRAALAAILSLTMGAVAADAEAVGEVGGLERPSSLAGSYLAGRSADLANDVDAALNYFDYTLEFDPRNPAISERVLMLRLAAGDTEPGFDLAENLVVADTRNPTARLALATQALKRKQYARAKSELKETLQSPLATLTADILDAWADYGLGKTDDALKTVESLTGPGWYDVFKDYHYALIADAGGRTADADTAISRAYDSDQTALRIVEAYARIKARSGDRDEATRALSELGDNPVASSVVAGLLDEIKSGKKPAPIAASAQAGGAELLYGLGSAIGTEDGIILAAIYLQLAHNLDPKVDIVTVALAELFQRVDQCEKAINIFGRVPDTSPIRRNASIQSAICLDSLDRMDEAATQIKRVLDADPNDIQAAIALGNLYRGHDRYAEAADAFTVGVKAITDEANADWRIFYFRGVAFERTKRWPEAEADFKRALKLNPNQPQVLNYLGYSWVDMGINLDQALDMIRTAVDLRPNDGYIVDSLGWAYYRLGRYEEAVEQMERAVELRPEDSVINDHLGDAYWRVNRKREATFQWAHARDLEPDEAELPKILDKLKNGLGAAQPEEKADDDAAEAPTAEPIQTAALAPGAGVDRQLPSSVTVGIGESLSTIAERLYGDSDQYLRIFDANRDRLSDPDVIFPGMTLTIPARESN